MNRQVELNINRLHELAVPLGEAVANAMLPLLERYADDKMISPEEFAASLIYMHCQGLDAAIQSAARCGADPTQLRDFVDKLLDAGFGLPDEDG